MSPCCVWKEEEGRRRERGRRRGSVESQFLPWVCACGWRFCPAAPQERSSLATTRDRNRCPSDPWVHDPLTMSLSTSDRHQSNK